MAATAQDSTAPLRMGPEKKDEDQDEYESEWGAAEGCRAKHRESEPPLAALSLARRGRPASRGRA